MNTKRFYYIGGAFSNVKWLDSRIPRTPEQIANLVFLGPKAFEDEKDAHACFHLGITPSGASYVLLPLPPEKHENGRDSKDYNFNYKLYPNIFRGRPAIDSDFISLSPIHFDNIDALAQKITTLTNKKTKRQGDNRDRSQANVAYTTASNLNDLTQVGINRANFEYHRVFYRLCRGTLDPDLYKCRRVPWFNDMDTLWSFAYNTWHMDRRTLDERRRDPKVLDISWTEYVPPSSSSDILALKTEHYVVEENRVLGKPSRGTYLHGESTTKSRAQISASLQKDFERATSARPVFLFVHDVAQARMVLESFGVRTSAWREGIELVIGREPLETNRVNYHRSPGRGGYDQRSSGRGGYDQRYRSERSRSPHRGGSNYGPRPASPARSPYPVYLVDVKLLYTTMRQVDGADETIATIARELRVNADKPEEPLAPRAPVPTLQGWCAGNESRLLGYMWSSMASGNAIDDQRLARSWSLIQQTHEGKGQKPQQASTSTTAPADDGSDSDRDPNDIVPAAQGTSASGGGNPYDSDDDDWTGF